MNEETQIAAVLAGDTDAYQPLVDRYQVGLIIHCERIVHTREAAEDVAQEAFLKAYLQLSHYDAAQSRFSTWLYRIATNKAIDYLRAHKRSISDPNIEELAGDVTLDYDDFVQTQTVRDAVARLKPPSHRKAIEAYYWQGKSYKQIASELNVPLNTLRTWLRRAKEQLRGELL